MRSIKKSIVSFLALMILAITPGTLYAALEQADLVPGSGDGLLVRDNNSGLEWLRLTETQGLSVADVIDTGVGGYAGMGFELASVDEVEALFLSGGIVELSTGFVEANYAPATLLIDLFGCLQGCDTGLPTTQGWVQAPDLPDAVLGGVVQTAACCPPSGRAYVLDISAQPKTTRNATMGVFLVRPISALRVLIDIVPRKSQNTINLKSQGSIDVAILTEGSFDALQVLPSATRFGPSGAAPISYQAKDIDRDGDKDLVMSFWIQQTGISCSDTEATLASELCDGTPIVGTDSVRPVRCR